MSMSADAKKKKHFENENRYQHFQLRLQISYFKMYKNQENMKKWGI